MINLNNKFNLILFLVLFFKDNFSSYDPGLKIEDENGNLYDYKGQECIKDKNGKLYSISRFDSNTSKEDIKKFLHRFSYQERTEEEKEIINRKRDIFDNKFFVYGKGIRYSIELENCFNKNKFYDNPMIVIENKYIKNKAEISYIGGLIIYFKEGKLPKLLNGITEIENKLIIEITHLDVCDLLKKIGLGSELLKKLDIDNSILYLFSILSARGFYEKNGYKRLDNFSSYFYKINNRKNNYNNKFLLALEFSSI